MFADVFLSTHAIRVRLKPAASVADEHSAVQSKCRKDKSSHRFVSSVHKSLKTFSEESNSEWYFYLILPGEINDADKSERVGCHAAFLLIRGLTVFSFDSSHHRGVCS